MAKVAVDEITSALRKRDFALALGLATSSALKYPTRLEHQTYQYNNRTPAVVGDILLRSCIDGNLPSSTASGLVRAMIRDSISLTSTSWNLALKACRSNPFEALKIAQAMKRNGCDPDLYSFSHLISAFRETQENTRDFFQHVLPIFPENILKKDISSLTQLIQMSVRSGLHQEVDRLINLALSPETLCDRQCLLACLYAIATVMPYVSVQEQQFQWEGSDEEIRIAIILGRIDLTAEGLCEKGAISLLSCHHGTTQERVREAVADVRLRGLNLTENLVLAIVRTQGSVGMLREAISIWRELEPDSKKGLNDRLLRICGISARLSCLQFDIRRKWNWSMKFSSSFLMLESRTHNSTSRPKINTSKKTVKQALIRDLLYFQWQIMTDGNCDTELVNAFLWSSPYTIRIKELKKVAKIMLDGGITPDEKTFVGLLRVLSENMLDIGSTGNFQIKAGNSFTIEGSALETLLEEMQKTIDIDAMQSPMLEAVFRLMIELSGKNDNIDLCNKIWTAALAQPKVKRPPIDEYIDVLLANNYKEKASEVVRRLISTKGYYVDARTVGKIAKAFQNGNAGDSQSIKVLNELYDRLINLPDAINRNKTNPLHFLYEACLASGDNNGAIAVEKVLREGVTFSSDSQRLTSTIIDIQGIPVSVVSGASPDKYHSKELSDELFEEILRCTPYRPTADVLPMLYLQEATFQEVARGVRYHSEKKALALLVKSVTEKLEDPLRLTLVGREMCKDCQNYFKHAARHLSRDIIVLGQPENTTSKRKGDFFQKS